jgi:7,8-dihydroneopterin aldolase/epimerase/oxygenase
MDTISIHELRVETLIGIHEWERRTPQTLLLDVDFAIPAGNAGRSDHIGDTIDYAEVVERVRTSLRDTHFVLLERLCEHVADLLRNDFKSPWTRVSAIRPGIIRGVKRVAVTIERGTRDPRN